MSPASDLPAMPLLGRHHSGDLGGFFGSAGGPIPPHLRTDFGPATHSPRSGSVSPSLSSYGGGSSGPISAGGAGGGHRPSLTSHPQMYGHQGPPPTLEPPTHHEPRSATGSVASAAGSPHLSSVGWQSPAATGSIGSPVPTGPGGEYMYPEPSFSMPPAAATGAHHLYYPSSHMRRPQSTEPADHYEAHKPRLVQSEVWSGQL